MLSFAVNFSCNAYLPMIFIVLIFCFLYAKILAVSARLTITNAKESLNISSSKYNFFVFDTVSYTSDVLIRSMGRYDTLQNVLNCKKFGNAVGDVASHYSHHRL